MSANRPGLILVTGGARSGKSQLAAELAERFGAHSVTYIATLQRLASDPEMCARIDRHRRERNPRWLTVEAPEALEAAVRAAATEVVLIDCLSGFVANTLMRAGDAPGDADAEAALTLVSQLVAAACQATALVVVVTNEVGWGVVPETPLGRLFRDVAGIANQRFAQAADEVWLTVAGLPLQMK